MKGQLKRAQEKLGKIWEEYKNYRNALGDDQSKWTDEQRERFDKYDADIDTVEEEIKGLKRSIKDTEREERFAETGDNSDGPQVTGDGAGGAGGTGQEERARNDAFNVYLRGGMNALTGEQRNLMAGSDVDGGFLVTPQKFVKDLLKAVDDALHIRKIASIKSLKQAASLGVVSIDSDVDDWEWTTELATGTDDDKLKFGKREMKPHPMAKRIKISDTLIRYSDRNVQGIVRERLARKLGVTQERAYMLGTGVNQALGLFTPSADGIPVERDVVGANTATKLAADTLIDVQGSIKDGYQHNARWLFHREVITAIRKLKNPADGQYLWQPGIAKGAQNEILGKPYISSEFVPKTMTTGLYVGLYGDFSYYWILDVLQVAIQVLKELYAETNQIGFIGRYEGDGQPVLAEAFSRIKMG